MNTKIVLKLSLIGLLAFSFANMTAYAKPRNRAVTRANNGHVKRKRPPSAARISVIIAKFENKSGASDMISDEIRTRIQQCVTGTMKFEVVDRERLKAELSGSRTATSGIVDADVTKTGKKQDAPYIVYGTVSCRTDKESRSSEGIACSVNKFEIKLQVKLANVETGSVIALHTVVGHGMDKKIATEWGGSHSTMHGMSDAIDEASHAVVDWLRDLVCPAKVLKVDKAEITIDMNENEVKEGDVFDVIEDGGVMVDPDSGLELKLGGKCIGRVVITRTGLQTSKAKPVDGGRFSLGKLDIRKCIYRLRRVSKAKGEAGENHRKFIQDVDYKF